jgi:hypothetical protein
MTDGEALVAAIADNLREHSPACVQRLDRRGFLWRVC